MLSSPTDTNADFGSLILLLRRFPALAAALNNHYDPAGLKLCNPNSGPLYLSEGILHILESAFLPKAIAKIPEAHRFLEQKDLGQIKDHHEKMSYLMELTAYHAHNLSARRFMASEYVNDTPYPKFQSIDLTSAEQYINAIYKSICAVMEHQSGLELSIREIAKELTVGDIFPTDQQSSYVAPKEGQRILYRIKSGLIDFVKHQAHQTQKMLHFPFVYMVDTHSAFASLPAEATMAAFSTAVVHATYVDTNSQVCFGTSREERAGFWRKTLTRLAQKLCSITSPPDDYAEFCAGMHQCMTWVEEFEAQFEFPTDDGGAEFQAAKAEIAKRKGDAITDLGETDDIFCMMTHWITNQLLPHIPVPYATLLHALMNLTAGSRDFLVTTADKSYTVPALPPKAKTRDIANWLLKLSPKDTQMQGHVRQLLNFTNADMSDTRSELQKSILALFTVRLQINLPPVKTWIEQSVRFRSIRHRFYNTLTHNDSSLNHTIATVAQPFILNKQDSSGDTLDRIHSVGALAATTANFCASEHINRMKDPMPPEVTPTLKNVVGVLVARYLQWYGKALQKQEAGTYHFQPGETEEDLLIEGQLTGFSLVGSMARAQVARLRLNDDALQSITVIKCLSAHLAIAFQCRLNPSPYSTQSIDFVDAYRMTTTILERLEELKNEPVVQDPELQKWARHLKDAHHKTRLYLVHRYHELSKETPRTQAQEREFEKLSAFTDLIGLQSDEILAVLELDKPFPLRTAYLEAAMPHFETDFDQPFTLYEQLSTFLVRILFVRYTNIKREESVNLKLDDLLTALEETIQSIEETGLFEPSGLAALKHYGRVPVPYPPEEAVAVVDELEGAPEPETGTPSHTEAADDDSDTDSLPEELDEKGMRYWKRAVKEADAAADPAAYLRDHAQMDKLLDAMPTRPLLSQAEIEKRLELDDYSTFLKLEELKTLPTTLSKLMNSINEGTDHKDLSPFFGVWEDLNLKELYDDCIAIGCEPTIANARALVGHMAKRIYETPFADPIDTYVRFTLALLYLQQLSFAEIAQLFEVKNKGRHVDLKQAMAIGKDVATYEALLHAYRDAFSPHLYVPALHDYIDGSANEFSLSCDDSPLSFRPISEDSETEQEWTLYTFAIHITSLMQLLNYHEEDKLTHETKWRTLLENLQRKMNKVNDLVLPHVLTPELPKKHQKKKKKANKKSQGKGLETVSADVTEDADKRSDPKAGDSSGEDNTIHGKKKSKRKKKNAKGKQDHTKGTAPDTQHAGPKPPEAIVPTPVITVTEAVSPSASTEAAFQETLPTTTLDADTLAAMEVAAELDRQAAKNATYADESWHEVHHHRDNGAEKKAKKKSPKRKSAQKKYPAPPLDPRFLEAPTLDDASLWPSLAGIISPTSPTTSETSQDSHSSPKVSPWQGESINPMAIPPGDFDGLDSSTSFPSLQQSMERDARSSEDVASLSTHRSTEEDMVLLNQTQALSLETQEAGPSQTTESTKPRQRKCAGTWQPGILRGVDTSLTIEESKRRRRSDRRSRGSGERTREGGRNARSMTAGPSSTWTPSNLRSDATVRGTEKDPSSARPISFMFARHTLVRRPPALEDPIPSVPTGQPPAQVPPLTSSLLPTPMQMPSAQMPPLTSSMMSAESLMLPAASMPFLQPHMLEPCQVTPVYTPSFAHPAPPIRQFESIVPAIEKFLATKGWETPNLFWVNDAAPLQNLLYHWLEWFTDAKVALPFPLASNAAWQAVDEQFKSQITAHTTAPAIAKLMNDAILEKAGELSTPSVNGIQQAAYLEKWRQLPTINPSDFVLAAMRYQEQLRLSLSRDGLSREETIRVIHLHETLAAEMVSAKLLLLDGHDRSNLNAIAQSVQEWVAVFKARCDHFSTALSQFAENMCWEQLDETIGRYHRSVHSVKDFAFNVPLKLDTIWLFSQCARSDADKMEMLKSEHHDFDGTVLNTVFQALSTRLVAMKDAGLPEHKELNDAYRAVLSLKFQYEITQAELKRLSLDRRQEREQSMTQATP